MVSTDVVAAGPGLAGRGPRPRDPGRGRRAARWPRATRPRWPTGSAPGSQFGTAGLRGEMGAGPNRMNRAVVIRATAGLAALPGGHGPRRRAGGRGLRRPPPLGPLRRRRRRGAGRRRVPGPPGRPAAADAGAGLRRARTWAPAPASRSPPATTRRPTTATRCTWATAPRSSRRPTPRSPRASTPSARWPSVPVAADDDPRIVIAGDALVDAYVAGALATATPAGPERDLRVVYTPLHGVGRDVLVGGADAGPGSRRRRSCPSRPSRTRLPHRRLPQPRGAGRPRPRPRPGRGQRRRPGDGQRPRRRPAGGGRAGARLRRRLAGADRRRDRGGAGRLAAGRGARAPTGWWPRPWCRRRCWAGWPRRGASATPRR